MNWLRRLLGIRTDFEIMLEHMRASHEADLQVIRQHAATIDRVVAARYDRPTLAAEPSTQSEQRVEEDFSDMVEGGDDDAFFERLEKL